jgi:hypothetical protein
MRPPPAPSVPSVPNALRNSSLNNPSAVPTPAAPRPPIDERWRQWVDPNTGAPPRKGTRIMTTVPPHRRIAALEAALKKVSDVAARQTASRAEVDGALGGAEAVLSEHRAVAAKFRAELELTDRLTAALVAAKQTHPKQPWSNQR